MDRGSITERAGVHLIGLVINKLGWVFREQPIMDYGIDATVEERKNANPTGRLLSLQIKTGSSFVETNASGDIDFYIDSVHLEYWLNYQNPVILVLCDPENEILYWRQIAKRNLTKTKNGKYKITIFKSSILNKESLSELEEILDTYSPNCNFDVDISAMTTEEVSEYAIDLLEHSKDSLSNISRALNQHQESTAKWKSELEKLQEDLSTGRIRTDLIKSQRIKIIGQKYKTATTVLTQRLVGSEKQIAVNTHTSAFCFIDKVIYEQKPDIQLFAQVVKIELINEMQSIGSVIQLLYQFANECDNTHKGWGNEFMSSMRSCSIALKDYAADLEFFCEIINRQIAKLNAEQNVK